MNAAAAESAPPGGRGSTLAAAVLTSVGLLAIPATAEDVTFQPQQASAWCWAAAGQMVMEQVDPTGDYTQATQADEVVPGCVRAPRNTCKGVNATFAGCNRPFFPAFHEFDFDFDDDTDPLDPTPLKTELDNGRPVLFGWCVPKHCGDTTKDSMGHWMVAVSADICAAKAATHMIQVYDPAPCCTGTYSPMTYDTYANGLGGLRFWRNYYRVRLATQAPPPVPTALSPSTPQDPLAVARATLTSCLPDVEHWNASRLLLDSGVAPPSKPEQIEAGGTVNRRYIPLASIGAVQTRTSALKAAVRQDPLVVLASRRDKGVLVSVILESDNRGVVALEDYESSRRQLARIREADQTADDEKIAKPKDGRWDEYVVVETGLHFIPIPAASGSDDYGWAVAIPSEIDCRYPKNDEPAEHMTIEKLIERVTVSH